MASPGGSSAHHAPGRHRAAGEGEVEHLAPRDQEWVPEPDEGERRLGEDRERDDEDRVGQHQWKHEWEDVVAEDVEIGGADRPCPPDETSLPNRERLRPDQARGGRPTEQSDHQDDVPQARADHCDDHDQQRQVGYHQEEVGESHDGAAQLAVVPGDQTQRPAHNQRDEGGGEPDDERNPRPVDEGREDVLAAVVGPQPVEGGRGLVDVHDGDPYGFVRVVWGYQRGKYRHDDGEQDHGHAHDPHRAESESAHRYASSMRGSSHP